MKSPGTLVEPPLRHGNGVVREHRTICHVALPQAHALAVFQINGGYYEHVPSQSRKFLSSVSPAVWLFSG